MAEPASTTARSGDRVAAFRALAPQRRRILGASRGRPVFLVAETRNADEFSARKETDS